MIGQIWTAVILDPMINILVLLYRLLFSNFALAILGLTIVVRLISYPLTQKQISSTKAMQELQPKIQALQKKHGKDRERLTQETMKLYKEHGINPAGGCLPMLIQMPIWFGLYQSIYQVLGVWPEQLVTLSQHLYQGIPFLSDIASQSIPLNNRFLWLNLGQPDPYYILPVLVAATFWLQQKMMTPPAADPQQASMSQSMQIMMPIMFGFFTLSVSSGLAIYWVASGVLQIVQQYLTTGSGGLRSLSVLPGREEDGRGKKKR